VEILASALILVACISIGLCGVVITRGRFRTSKHSRQYIKDIQQDLSYIREQKNQEIKDLRQETLRLKGVINKTKQGVTVTDGDLKNSSGIVDMLVQKLIPNKYQELVKPYIPKAEAYVAQNKDSIIEQIKNINTKNQSKPPTETTATL